MICSMALFSDCRRALAGRNDGTIDLYDLRQGRIVTTFQTHSGPVRSVALSPDGHYAALRRSRPARAFMALARLKYFFVDCQTKCIGRARAAAWGCADEASAAVATSAQPRAAVPQVVPARPLSHADA